MAMARSPPPSGMTGLAVTTFKFASVASLGLLTGTTLSQSILTPPSLLSLPQPTSASSALSSLKRSFLSLHRSLARGTIAIALSAFILSPRGWRHPYLLWLSLVTGLTARYAAPEVHFFTLPESKWLAFLRVEDSGSGKSKGKRRVGDKSPDGSDRDWDELRVSEAALEEQQDGAVNGEVVQARIHAWGKAMTKLAAGYALAFAMGLLGVWGDGFRG